MTAPLFHAEAEWHAHDGPFDAAYTFGSRSVPADEVEAALTTQEAEMVGTATEIGNELARYLQTLDLKWVKEMGATLVLRVRLHEGQP